MESPVFLQYHKVTRGIEIGGTWVHPAIFKRHVEFLRKRRVPSLTREDLREGIPEKRAVLFTFDDAYSCVYKNAFPALKEAGYVGAVFVITSFIGKTNSWDLNFGFSFKHLNAQELRELSKEGWIIGSHSHTHRDLTRLSEDELLEELIRSKEILEDTLGEEVFAIAYPYGRYSLNVIKAAQRAGYKLGFGTHKGMVYKGYENLTIHRRGVYAIDISIRAKVEHIPVLSGIEIGKEYLISRVSDLSPVVKKLLSSLQGRRT